MQDETRRLSNSAVLPALMILLQSLLYGFGDPISKAAYETTPLFTLLSLRYFIAFAALLPFRWRSVLICVREVSPRVWALPGLCIALCYVLNNLALTLTEATSVAFLRSLSTVITPLFAFLAFHKRYDRRHIAVQILVLPGLYLLCGAGGLSGFGVGELLTILSACFMAGALVFGQDSLQSIDPLTLTAIQTGCSFLFALLGACAFEGGVSVASVTPKVWAIILYLALTCTLAGYLLQNKALEKMSARAVALFQCICPVMTAVFSYFILGERLSLLGILGACVIVCCVAAESLIKD